MLTGVIGLSTIPAIIVLSGGSESPFMFNFWVRLGFVIGCVVFVLQSSRHRRSVDNRTLFLMTWQRLLADFSAMTALRTPWRQRMMAASLPVAALHAFDYAILAWAVSFVDVAVAAVVYEIWPMTTIFLTARLIGDRYAAFTWRNAAYLGCCFAGVAVVILSQEGKIDLFDGQSAGTVIGVSLTILGVLATTLAVYAFSWGAAFNKSLVARGYEDHDGAYQDLVCVIIAHALSSALILPVVLGIAVIGGDTWSWGSFALLAATGGVVVAMSSICLRKANVVTTNLGVNAIAYGTPILSLLWLSLMSVIDVARPELVVAGAAMIVAANLLLNFEAEIRRCCRSLIHGLRGRAGSGS